MHNMEHYTFIGRDDTIPRNPEPLYVDPYGYTDYTPPNETNDYYEPFPVHLRNPSEIRMQQMSLCRASSNMFVTKEMTRELLYVLQ
jgi:hypothetical protein